MKKLISRIISVIAVLIFLFAALIFATVIATSNNRVPSLFGYSFLNVMTGSMIPELPVGTVVVVKETPPEELKTGDIISFYSVDPSISGKPNTHRIIAISNENGVFNFTTKGDANVLEDKYPVGAENIIGKVVGQTSLMAKVAKLRANKAVFMLMIFIPMMAVIFFEVGSIQKARLKKDTEETEKKQDETKND